LRRIKRLGVVALAAIALTVAAVVSSSNGARTSVHTVPVVSAAEMQRLLAKVPQQGDTLGFASAPVTVIEFADLQCPYCQAYTLSLFPYILANYVVPGKIKIVWRGLSFVGPDSRTAGRAALAAAEQDKLWNFTDAFFYRQARENSGYVTDVFLRIVASSVPDLNVRRLMHVRSHPVTALALENAEAQSKASGVKATPTFIITRAGRPPLRVVGFVGLPRALSQALRPS
jgi:protein-disulfide isomerase